MSRTAALLLAILIASPAFGQAKAPEPVPGGPEYLLGPDDVIHIQVWGRSDLTGECTIESSGKIRLPLVGEIDASGRTTADLGRHLTERYQLLDPSIPEVMVTVAQYNNLSVTVVGEVRSPGRYGFRTIPDLWNIILTAGGPTRDADLANVQIVHRESKEGEANTLKADLSQGVEGTARETLPPVRSKDTVVVPTLTGSSEIGDRIQVLGAVRTPGLYRTGAAKNVLEAIAVCGGPLPEADMSEVRLTRTSGAEVVSYQLNLRGYLYDARPDANFELQAGDIITVPAERSLGRSIVDAIGRITPVISVTSAVVGLIWATR